MKVLLDECVPAPLVRLLPDHECMTVAQCGWLGIQNGALIKLAGAEFDVFITCDQNIRFQQNLSYPGISILELSTNDFRRIKASIALIQTELSVIGSEKIVRVKIP